MCYVDLLSDLIVSLIRRPEDAMAVYRTIEEDMADDYSDDAEVQRCLTKLRRRVEQLDAMSQRPVPGVRQICDQLIQAYEDEVDTCRFMIIRALIVALAEAMEPEITESSRGNGYGYSE